MIEKGVRISRVIKQAMYIENPCILKTHKAYFNDKLSHMHSAEASQTGCLATCGDSTGCLLEQGLQRNAYDRGKE